VEVEPDFDDTRLGYTPTPESTTSMRQIANRAGSDREDYCCHNTLHTRQFHSEGADRSNSNGMSRSTNEAVLINDPNGLCLSASDPSMQSRSGIYSSLLKLALQLDEKPRILIETKAHNTYIKEYEGHTVVMKVSSATTTSSSSDGANDGEGSGSERGVTAGNNEALMPASASKNEEPSSASFNYAASGGGENGPA